MSSNSKLQNLYHLVTEDVHRKLPGSYPSTYVVFAATGWSRSILIELAMQIDAKMQCYAVTITP